MLHSGGKSAVEKIYLCLCEDVWFLDLQVVALGWSCWLGDHNDKP